MRWISPTGCALPDRHRGFDEYIDLADQILVFRHPFVEDGRARTVAGALRYVWSSELDLMAELAGMWPEHRWGGSNRGQFTGDSGSHVSIWLEPDEFGHCG